ncbi:MAG: threonine dehydratase [Blastocatellia bacterium]
MSDAALLPVSPFSLAAIRAARDIICHHMLPTPLLEHPLLTEETGLRLLLKHENHLPTGAFKVRGGLNFMSQFATAPTHTGVITATRGNHGQSIACAAKLYGITSTIIVPLGNNPEKNAAMRAYGARLIEHGQDFDEARLEAARLAETQNLRFIHSFNEPALVNGVGVYALEIIEKLQDWRQKADAVFVPIGMGSGLCGVITAFRALSPETRIYGVQATGAPSYYLSWKNGFLTETPEAGTFADGVATRCPAQGALDIMLRGPGEGVDEIILVDEAEIEEAIRLLWRSTHNLVEGAGAIAVAAALKIRDRLRDQTIVAVISGGNLDTATLKRIFST